MKKLKKLLACLLIMATMISIIPVGACAEESSGITPRYSNVNACSLDFIITDSGLAQVKVSYEGRFGYMTQVRSEIYLQKRVLGIFWKKVDIGVTDNVWVDTSTEDAYFFTHSAQLQDTGTYRAVFEVTFSGTGGADDVVADKIQYNY